MTLKDQQILEFIYKGLDNQALAVIYKSSLPKIRRYIVSNNGTEDDVKDIFQDTIVIFYRQIKTGKFNEGADIDGFLFTIARNLYINHVKRYSSRNVKIGVWEEEDSTDDLLQQIIGKEKDLLINKLFSELGKTCNEVLKLSVFNNSSMKEIAQIMGFSNENVAKTKSYKCRQRLSELVKNNKELKNYFKP